MKTTPKSFTSLKPLYGALLLMFLGVLVGYSQLLTNVNFNSDTVGSPPSVGTITGTGTDSFVLVIDQPQNYAGTGRGVQIFDNSATLGPQYRLNFVPDSGSVVSAVRFDFAIAPLSVSGSASQFSQIGVLGYNSSAATAANLYGHVRLYGNGQLRFLVGSSVTAYSNSLSR